jgi:hypothetical protein
MPKLSSSNSSKSMKKRNYEADEEHDEEPIEEQQQPRKIIKNVSGQTKIYYFLTTVKTMTELDKCLVKVKFNQ